MFDSASLGEAPRNPFLHRDAADSICAVRVYIHMNFSLHRCYARIAGSAVVRCVCTCTICPHSGWRTSILQCSHARSSALARRRGRCFCSGRASTVNHGCHVSILPGCFPLQFVSMLVWFLFLTMILPFFFSCTWRRAALLIFLRVAVGGRRSCSTTSSIGSKRTPTISPPRRSPTSLANATLSSRGWWRLAQSRHARRDSPYELVGVKG